MYLEISVFLSVILGVQVLSSVFEDGLSMYFQCIEGCISTREAAYGRGAGWMLSSPLTDAANH